MQKWLCFAFLHFSRFFADGPEAADWGDKGSEPRDGKTPDWVFGVCVVMTGQGYGIGPRREFPWWRLRGLRILLWGTKYGEFLIADPVMESVESLLAEADAAVELKIVEREAGFRESHLIYNYNTPLLCRYQVGALRSFRRILSIA